MEVEIKPDPRHPETHRLVIVTTKNGLVYATRWAQPWPDEARVREAWRTDRRDFAPYNSSEDTFLYGTGR